MHTYSLKITSLLFIGLLWSCLSTNGPDTLTLDRANRLLALDTGKIWQRISLRIDGDRTDIEDCQLANRYEFIQQDAGDTLLYLGSPNGCTSISNDTLAIWSWETIGNIKNEFQDSLMLTDEDGLETFRVIREITANNLRWEFEMDGQEIEEELTWINDSIP